MKTDVTLSFSLSGVIQLVDEHTNQYIQSGKARIYTSCPTKVVQKENGIYVFLNAESPEFQVRVELPAYRSETQVLKRCSLDDIKPVRMTPKNLGIWALQNRDVTYFSGTAQPEALVRLLCPVRYCQIRFCKQLRDGRILMESGNFLYAATGRSLLLRDKTGRTELIQTAIDKVYLSERYFVSAEPLKAVSAEDITEIQPVFCARADAEGNFIIAVEEAEEKDIFLIAEDGTQTLVTAAASETKPNLKRIQESRKGE